MNDRNDSLLEIATSLMKRKKKPQTLDSILEEVFQKKGIAEADDNVVAQF
jgi:DNA-directed RNA polymerase delta subunit